MECGFFLDNHKEVHPSTVDYQADTVNSTLLSFVPRTTRDTSGITVGQNPPNDCISYDSPESSQSLSTSCEMACQHDFFELDWTVYEYLLHNSIVVVHGQY